ncbi:hypothetical protein KR074_011072, partial [Drosophila pseudoananassae]
GDCSITKTMIESTNRIFTKRDASNNYELNRLAKVRTGEVLHMVCQENDIVPITCQINGIFDRKFPMDCPNPIAPTATIVEDASCSATMYSVGYTIHNSHLELYRACYDRTFVKALFTTHSVFQKSFSTERACPQLTTDGALSDADGNSFTPANVFNSFRRILGRNQRFIRNDRDTVILPARLTPSADFLFGDQICATSKYINVVPLFKSINDGNLQTIERWVRTTVGVGGHMRIRTGVLGTLSLRGTERRRRQHPIFLIAPNKNPVPEWIFKVVRTAANQPHTVFLTYNNIFGNRRPNAPNFCRSVPCPVPLANTAAAGYTFCCNAASFNR